MKPRKLTPLEAAVEAFQKAMKDEPTIDLALSHYVAINLELVRIIPKKLTHELDHLNTQNKEYWADHYPNGMPDWKEEMH